MVLLVTRDARADEWTNDSFTPERVWRTPQADPEKLERFRRREKRRFENLTVTDRQEARVRLRTIRANDPRESLTSDAFSDSDLDASLRELMRGEQLTPGPGLEGIAPAKTQADLFQLASDLRERAARRAQEDMDRAPEWSVIGFFQRLRNWGFSLKDKARKPIGYKDPATLAYERNLVTDEEKLNIDFGLTWSPKGRWVLGRSSNGAITTYARPILWIDGDITTTDPDEDNHWGVGAALDIGYDACGICPSPCCGTVRWKIPVGVDWVRSQKGKRQRATAWVAVEPVVADVAMGWRKPLGPYATAPISFVWQPSVRVDYGRNIEGSTRFEASRNFLRGTFSTYGTLYFDGVGRWVRGQCHNKGTLCDTENDPDRRHDPYFQAAWEGYLLDDEEWRDWFKLSVVYPLNGNPGFQIVFAWEKGAQAPITFNHKELFSIKIGLRF